MLETLFTLAAALILALTVEALAERSRRRSARRRQDASIASCRKYWA